MAQRLENIDKELGANAAHDSINDAQELLELAAWQLLEEAAGYETDDTD